jgi:hypothetical protein
MNEGAYSLSRRRPSLHFWSPPLAPAGAKTVTPYTRTLRTELNPSRWGGVEHDFQSPQDARGSVGIVGSDHGPATTCRQTSRWRSGSRSRLDTRVSATTTGFMISRPTLRRA